jgi:DNA-binding LacI/PurR family transcriptional regulator
VVTMADVARRAGVSVSTVSYALTGTRPISRPTRERIERAMAELEYTPNAFARGLKSKRSRIIALLFPTRVRGLGLSSLEYILGASDHAQERGYHLLLWTTEPDALDDLAQLAGQGLIDGVLMMEVTLRDPRIAVLRKTGVAFAMIGRTEDSSGIDLVDTDFDQCAALAVEHLAGLGHRRLGFINLGPAAVHSGRGNAVRLLDAVCRATMDSGGQLVTVLCENTARAGRDAFREMVRRDGDLTAVISFNEQAVPGVIHGATEYGWHVPRDLSIVSIDVPPQAAEMTTPPMSTVGPSAAAMGRHAIDVLIRRVEGEAGSARQELFPGQLHVRGTSGPARRPVPG